eukprot:scaffold103998_cov69-Phaeocystis_antarctica.AAC.3
MRRSRRSRWGPIDRSGRTLPRPRPRLVPRRRKWVAAGARVGSRSAEACRSRHLSTVRPGGAPDSHNRAPPADSGA